MCVIVKGKDSHGTANSDKEGDEEKASKKNDKSHGGPRKMRPRRCGLSQRSTEDVMDL